MGDNRYDNLTAPQEDNLCEGENFQQILQEIQIIDQRDTVNSLKRHSTNRSEIQYHDENNFEENEGFRQQTKHRQHKRPNYNARDERSKITTSRTYTNSNSNSSINEKRNNQQGRMQMNNNNRYNNNDHDQNKNEHQRQISQQALNYAAEIHLQPIKFECDPKFTQQKLAAKFIRLFFKYIEKIFVNRIKLFQIHSVLINGGLIEMEIFKA
ncbi:unnamed protein product [Didymodactylos carnosus]|uniref:Uncharacterized protein n=1 Tax=Didymodactylos carnosus TaxID=1234261 RepID=A0A815EX50_9BILA|nr:unnamed protein product [Didymodactylos carnosus]CAF4161591.1 unnamed protein product [Didymodactylos carnosus]